MKQHHQQQHHHELTPHVVLADTFPAKAHLLISYLTQVSPKVCSFSEDGTSFYVYDQAEFAQNLPQYFKHSNYGSFVRQLNLYGFNSSRLKDKNGVVEWRHENFQRDRKDLVNEIKRTKKSKSSRSKPSHIHVEPRSTSPGMPSYSDDAASSSVADSDAVACPVKRRVSGTDYEWLAAEFAVLKRQNESLERKLDQITTMFEITLRISEHREHPGEKRRRKVASDFQYNTKEEEKISDTDTHHMEVIEPVPYHDAARKGNASDNEMGDSLTAFIDIMLKNEDGSQALEHDVRVASSENTDDECGVARASATSNATCITDLDNHYEDELMEEALNANLPDSTLNTDGDLFCSDENEPSMRDSSEQDIVTITNAAQDKADGPEPVEAISSPNVPSYEVVGDIEEANVPIGVHVISAHAQLVEEDDRNEERRLTNWHTGIFSEDRRHKKRVICLLGFLVFAVIAVVVVFPTVTITQRKRKQENLKGKTVIIKPPPCGEGKDRHDCFPDRPHLRPNDGWIDKHEEYNDDGYFDYPKKDEDKDTESSLSPMTNDYHSSKPQLARHSVRYRDNLSHEKNISVTVDGTSYECSNPLFV